MAELLENCAANMSSYQPRILIVDDREENLFAIEELLSTVGAEIVRALSGTEALEILARDANFSLILMDVQMPKLDGFSTVELIKKHPRTKKISIIFVTALYKDDRYIRKGYEVGGNDYICKPIDPKVLISKTKFYLDVQREKSSLENLVCETTKIEQGKNLILENAQDGIVACNSEGMILYANPSAIKILEYSTSQILKENIMSIVYRDHKFITSWVGSPLQQSMIDAKVIRSGETSITKSDGESVEIRYSFGPYDTPHGTGAVFQFQDLSYEKHFENKLLHMATHDTQTGLPNRVMFREFIRDSMARAKRLDENFIVVFIGLDHFRKINDELGRDAGDRLLVHLTKKLLNFDHGIRYISRLGGDEFSLIIEESLEDFHFHSLITGLLELISEPITLGGRDRFTTASIGIVKYPGCVGSIDEFLKAGDIATNIAKDRGRNQYVVFNENDAENVESRYSFENDLNTCIKEDQTICHFQPIMDSNNGSLASMEVLLRWPHKERGMIMPDSIIPVAEETNLIVELGGQVIDHSFSQLSDWLEKGLWPDGARLAINISTRQFHRGIIVNQIKKSQEKYNLDLNKIDIEITESLVMEDPETVINILSAIKELGVKIAIDDFGTGYSSLMYLKRLPIDIIKIDRFFVKEIGINEIDEVIIRSTIELSHSLGLKTVAEGVETGEQEQFLMEMGSDYLQGYKYSKPMNKEDATNWLEQYKSDIKNEKLN